MKSQNSQIIGPYNQETGNVDLSEIPTTIYSRTFLSGLSDVGINLILELDKLNAAFPWLYIKDYLVLAGKLNDSRVWEIVLRDISKEEQIMLAQGQTKSLNLPRLAQGISQANARLFMMSTQLCFVALLCGSDNLKNYITLDHVELPFSDKFIKAAQDLVKTLEIQKPATDMMQLENRIREAFSLIENNKGKSSTPIHDHLDANGAFGACPFKNGTRILYIKFNEWLESLPKGFMHHLMKGR